MQHASTLAALLLVVLPALPTHAAARAVSPPASQADVEAEEDEGPDFALIMGLANIGLGAALALSGGVVHVVGEDQADTATVLYALGGFVALIGVYVLATGLGGHPGEPEPTLVVAPWIGPGVEGAGLELRW